jgi:hypothetical protein
VDDDDLIPSFLFLYEQQPKEEVATDDTRRFFLGGSLQNSKNGHCMGG